MPKYELKNLYSEFEKKIFWPVYWVYGPEKMKGREFLKKLQSALPPGTPIETLDASGLSKVSSGSQALTAGVTVNDILDQAQSFSLFSPSLKVLVIRDAHLLKEVEKIEPLFGPQGKIGEGSFPPTLCVFFAKDWDQRKKISKHLLEKVAVFACDEVPESERGSWIHYLEDRKKLEPALSKNELEYLKLLEPWSLDRIDQELARYQVMSETDREAHAGALGGGRWKSQDWIDCILNKRFQQAWQGIAEATETPDTLLSLIGLLAWNFRQLSAHKAGHSLGNGPYFDRLKKVSGRWSLAELSFAQDELVSIDQALKSTSHSGFGMLGQWLTRLDQANV